MHMLNPYIRAVVARVRLIFRLGHRGGVSLCRRETTSPEIDVASANGVEQPKRGCLATTEFYAVGHNHRCLL